VSGLDMKVRNSKTNKRSIPRSENCTVGKSCSARMLISKVASWDCKLLQVVSAQSTAISTFGVFTVFVEGRVVKDSNRVLCFRDDFTCSKNVSQVSNIVNVYTLFLWYVLCCYLFYLKAWRGVANGRSTQWDTTRSVRAPAVKESAARRADY